MNTKRTLVGLMIFLVTAMEAGVGKAGAATNDVSGLLQQGLLEEEANHNLQAAITAYQAVITQTEKNRQFEATAIFRLGECYRKLGRTNEANAQYQRILNEFADQTELATLSRSYLGTVPGVPSTTTPGPYVMQQDPVYLALDKRRQDYYASHPEDFAAYRASVSGGASSPAAGATTGVVIDEEAAELKRIQAMIKDSPDLINGTVGQIPPLINAARLDYLNVARFLLDNHADVNVRGDQSRGFSAIGIATQEGHKEMVELLLDRGADVNDASGQGLKPLQIAAQRGYRAIAEVLIAHKADVNIGNGGGYTPLHRAAQNGFQSVAELLLANGAEVNAVDSAGQSPLHEAASSDNPAMIEMLIAHKADVNAAARDGSTPLIVAARNRRVNVARLLLANHANVNAQTTAGTPTGWRPLHFAVDAGQNDLVKLLLDNGADPDAVIPIYYAAGDNTTDNYHNPNDPKYSGCTPLLMTIINRNDRKETARLLIEHKANVNLGDTNGLAPLALAARYRREDIAELLLANGADVNLRDRSGQSPLSEAVRSPSVEMVKLILAHKPNLETLDQSHWTPLQWAIATDPLEIVALLLDAGAAPDSIYPQGQTLAGMTPLEAAISYSHWPQVDLLLKHKADPNFRDANGNTPLSHVKDVERVAANDPARMAKLAEIKDLLRKAGANENLERLSAISVSRGGANPAQRVFRTNSLNHFTLLQLLGAFYAPPLHGSYYVAGGGVGFLTQPDNSRLPGLAFPDFSRISISRLGRDGRTNQIAVNLLKLLDGGDCSQDLPLAWGDIVEIPEADHNVSEVWQGLSSKDRLALGKCLTLTVQILVKGRTNALSLTPYWYSKNSSPGGQLIVGPGGDITPDFLARLASRTHYRESDTPGRANNDGGQVVELSSFWLSDVVRNANVILTSSDLSRVKVTRVDPATGKKVEMVFDLRQENERTADNAPGTSLPQPARLGESPSLSPEQQMMLIEAQRNDALRQGSPMGTVPPPAPLATLLSNPRVVTEIASQDGTHGEDLWLRDGDVIEVPEMSGPQKTRTDRISPKKPLFSGRWRR
ncbi:MAG TPA: ankyrin repeat domain-containing protein [Verrucomicrobiae bacterium]|nr:ankyrin repeat domain-containing protein [Verrucomicrobiae bacterium]